MNAPAIKPTGDIGVYVHFPYCLARCPYCDFKVDVVREVPGDAYRDAILAELAGRLTPALAGRRLRSIYFGGGTPSLWEPQAIGDLIDAACRAFGAPPETLEITVEANPRELTHDRIARLVDAGVNRVSLGIQSFDDATLRRLGRDHDAAAAHRALSAALGSEVARVTFDLIAAVPGRDATAWRGDLTAAEAYLEAGHVSVYELTVHAGTPFARMRERGRLPLVDEALAETVWLEAEAFLGARGLQHYEVSNYARPGLEAVHNSLYWRGGEYLGLGVAAHSMTVSPEAVARRENVRSTADYLDDPLAEPAAQERLTAPEHLRERLFLGLRTSAGVDLADVAEQLGVPVPVEVTGGLERCRERGWLVLEGRRWRPTPRGLRFADAVAVEVL